MFSSKDLFFTTSGGYRVSNSLRFRSSASAYLSRTFTTPTNNKIWTWSGWVKRGQLGTTQTLISAGPASTNNCQRFWFNSDDTLRIDLYGTGSTYTTAVYRDPSAWYHVVCVFDTTQTSANIVKIWVNGVSQVLNNQLYTQNSTYPINAAQAHNIGKDTGGASYLDGYLAEVNFIDGQALTPSSFGAYDSNGVWQPARYTGAYGTNGFYLPFSDNSALTTASNAGLGKDFSGNTNYWVTNNISITAGTTYDSMIDSPTNYSDGGNGRGNYATLNPNVTTVSTTSTITNANLTLNSTNTNGTRCSSIAMSSGKWYAEVTLTTNPSNSDPVVGIASATNTVINYPGATSDSYGIYCYPTNTYLQKVNNGTFTNTNATSSTNGTVIGVAVDLDNNKIWFSKNGTFVDSGDPAAGTNSQFTLSAGTYYFAARGSGGAGSCVQDFNFGQRPFAYTAPSGFLALNTQNLPTPTIANGAQYMAAVTYTGNGTASTAITASSNNSGNNPLGTTFQPDLVWIKSRSATTNNNLFDTLRTATNYLISNSTAANASNANTLTAFNSNGFTLGTDAGSIGVNVNAATYVAWEWNAGSGSSSSNTSGTITSTVSANVSAGFSVVTYTGTGANATVGHGLGVAPSMIIFKARANVTNWPVYHASLTSGGVVYLNLTNAYAADTTQLNNTAPTSSVFSIGTSGSTNPSSTMVAYCFAPVAGYSAFGSYTGNGSTDGPFVYLGFRPRWVMVKRTDAAGENWYPLDSSRDPYNPEQNWLAANSSGAENGGGSPVVFFDFLSNGFKIRNTGTFVNTSSATYIYAAFAENPLKFSRAR